jgi:hypothetical protein
VLLITLFLPLAIQPDSIAHADGPGVEYWAVIVGISTYLYIDDLNHADDDATALYQKLSPILGSDHISLLTNSNAGKTAIQNSIQNWLAPREDSDDVVLFYFSGHGGQDSGNYVICPYNSLTYSWSNDIFDYELSNWLSVLDSNNVVVTLDTCDSGGFITDLSATSQVIMASSAASESSYDSSGLQHGVFTYYLLQSIDNPNVTDTNADYILTTQEIFNYASPRVTQWEVSFGNTQHPVNYDSYSGGLSLFMITAISTNVPSAAITIDGEEYTIPNSILLIPNGSHQVIAQSEVSNGITTRYVFLSWNDGSTAPTRIISQGVQYIATYKTQYYFSVSAERGSVAGTEWYDVGSMASTSTALETITDGNQRYVFQHWDVDGSAVTGNPATISMYSPHTASADYETQYYLSVSAEHGSVSGTGWYDTGAAASTGTAEQTVNDGDTRYIFQHWDVDGTAKTTNPVTIYMNAPHTATTDYKTQYYLNIQSKYGDPSGGGWYDANTAAEVSVTPVVGTLIRHKFNGWSGDSNDDYSSTSVYMNQPKSIVATWKADYLYLYLLIGGVLGVCILITVFLTVRARDRRLSRRIAKKQRKYA